MTDLLHRLSAATGPSRELDAEIAVALRLLADFDESVFVVPIAYMVDERRGAGYVGAYWRDQDGEPFPVHSRPAPAYTASIDAALTLMPEGAFWSVLTAGGNDGRYHAAVNLWRGGLDHQEGATPAIALLIAILKARQP